MTPFSYSRLVLNQDPLPKQTKYSFSQPPWPVHWIGPADYTPSQSEVLLFRRDVHLPQAVKTRLHISADQRYDLIVDGELIGRGPGRSDLWNWVYESYELILAPGPHRILARVWWICPADGMPESQLTHRPALLVYADGAASDLFSTGMVEWHMHRLPGYAFRDFDRLNAYFAIGALPVLDGRLMAPAAELGDGEGWTIPSVVGNPHFASQRRESDPWWILRPSNLPALYEARVAHGAVRHVEAIASEKTHSLPVSAAANILAEQAQWNALWQQDQPLTIPAHTQRRVLLDLDNYFCSFPVIVCAGEGAWLRLHWAESLYHVGELQKNTWNSKGNRDEVEGKCFYGVGLEITAAQTPLTYRTPTFHSGRYVEIVVRTADAPLVIESLRLQETHFPYNFGVQFGSSHEGHAHILPPALRALEMCSHDTHLDTPYYERLNYVGDTRLQSLVAYATAAEYRLAERCMELFDYSRHTDGLTSSRYPTRTVQIIPPFSLWWVCMLHDHALWQDRPAFTRARLPGMRAVLEAWRNQLTAEGLLLSPRGWNFVDWVPNWDHGVPAGGHSEMEYSSILNLQAVYTLQRAADLEDFAGEPLLAQRQRSLATALLERIRQVFYDPQKGLYADEAAHTLYSEHAQCLAVLAGAVTGAESVILMDTMIRTPGLVQTTVYFTHYLFEAFGQTGHIAALLDRLKYWENMQANGLRTTSEMPEPTRSDCHAWGAHPVYHYLATLAGIRPAGFGFRQVSVHPQMGRLTHIEGVMPHRCGPIEFSWQRRGNTLAGHITLPPGLSGAATLNGATRPLSPGKNIIA